MIKKTSLLLLLNLFAWVQTCDYLMYLFSFVNYFYQEAPLKLAEKEETTSLQTEFVEKKLSCSLDCHLDTERSEIVGLNLENSHSIVQGRDWIIIGKVYLDRGTYWDFSM